jgi:hypothetical protein
MPGVESGSDEPLNEFKKPVQHADIWNGNLENVPIVQSSNPLHQCWRIPLHLRVIPAVDGHVQQSLLEEQEYMGRHAQGTVHCGVMNGLVGACM